MTKFFPKKLKDGSWWVAKRHRDGRTSLVCRAQSRSDARDMIDEWDTYDAMDDDRAKQAIGWPNESEA